MSLRLELRYTFSAPPDRIWPLVADTERLNRALGLPATRYEPLPAETEVGRARVRARLPGVTLAFEEEPFEWVENRSHRVFRRFLGGPFRTFHGGVTLTPDGRGTNLLVWAEFVPRGPAGRPFFALLRAKTRRDWNRFVARIHRHVAGEAAAVYGPGIDRARDEVRRRVRARLREAPAVVRENPLAPRLFEHLAGASDMEVGRIRPFALARAWGVDRYELLALCLRATRESVLDLSWDLLCPNCRGETSLTRLDELGTRPHCDTCHIVYDATFDRNVEVTFRPTARYRAVTRTVFCAAGPGNTPHILAQTVLPPGGARSLRARLGTGAYRLRTLTGRAAARIEVGDATNADGNSSSGGGSPTGELTAVLAAGGIRLEPEDRILEPGELGLNFRNETGAPAQLIMETAAWESDCATAAAVSVYQEFRDLFSSVVLAPDVQVGIASLPILFTDLQGSTSLYERLGDAAAYALVMEHFRLLQDAVREWGGGVIKTIGDSVMAAFPDAAAAVACSLAAQARVQEFNRTRAGGEIVLKIGLHQGPCIAVQANERLDYFGTTVNVAARLNKESRGDDLVVSEAILADASVTPLLTACRQEAFEASLRGITDRQRLWRILPPSAQRIESH
jgi:class 3 adenylate cyclase